MVSRVTVILLSLNLCASFSLGAMELPLAENKQEMTTSKPIPATEFFKLLPADMWRMIMNCLDIANDIFVNYCGRYIEPSNAQLEQLVDEIDAKLSIACDNLQEWIAGMIKLLENDCIVLYLDKQKPYKGRFAFALKSLNYKTSYIKIMKKIAHLYKNDEKVTAFISFKRPNRAIEKFKSLFSWTDKTGGKAYQAIRQLLCERLENAQKILAAMKTTVSEIKYYADFNAPDFIHLLLKPSYKLDDKDATELGIPLKKWSKASVKSTDSKNLSLLESLPITSEKDLALYLQSMDKTQLKKLTTILAKSLCFALTYRSLIEDRFYVRIHRSESAEFVIGTVTLALVGEAGLTALSYFTQNWKFLTTGSPLLMGALSSLLFYWEYLIKSKGGNMQLGRMLKSGSFDTVRLLLSPAVDEYALIELLTTYGVQDVALLKAIEASIVAKK